MTQAQHECLKFLRDRIAATGVCPSFEEIAYHLHLRSKSGVARLVAALEERGHIRRVPGRRRAIEVVSSAPGGPLSDAEVAWCQSHAARIRALIRDEAPPRVVRRMFHVERGGLT